MLQQPNGNHKDTEINDYALPILVQDTLTAQSADIDMVSGATVTSDGYVQSLAGRPRRGRDLRPPSSGSPHGTHRRVEQLMGMPVSVALRGRHADTAAGEEAWQAVIEELREVDRVFSTYRPDSVISRLDRARSPSISARPR